MRLLHFYIYFLSLHKSMPKDRAQKPCGKPTPYQCRPKQPSKKDVPKTSVKLITSSKCINLTLADWLTVINFVNDHPHLSQERVIDHFQTKREGALIFTQSALSQKLRNHTKLNKRSQSNPSALSVKRPCVVMQPNVERALVLWINHMIEKGETISGPMLCKKRKWFEELFKVPDDQKLREDRWVASFCKTYKLKKYRQHGEAGSVDPKAVEKKQKHLQDMIKKFTPRDQWNFDETSLFLM
jgi:Tc5 transposase DNA-binding domain